MIATERDPENVTKLSASMTSRDDAIRYWSILGLNVLGESAVKPLEKKLVPRLNDNSPCVRIVAAEALANYGNPDLRESAIETLLKLSNVKTQGPFVSTLALNSLDSVDPAKLVPYTKQIRELPTSDPSLQQRLRMSAVTPNLLKYLLKKIESAGGE